LKGIAGEEKLRSVEAKMKHVGRGDGLCSVTGDFSIRQFNIDFKVMLRTIFFFPCRKDLYEPQSTNSLEPKSIPVNRCFHLTSCFLS
jgi:hypothetical protein